MTFRNFSLFTNPANIYNYFFQHQKKSWSEKFVDSLNWIYENSPINFSTLTGMYHPSVERVMGNPIFGRALNVKNADEFANEMLELEKAAKKDPKKRAYSSFATQKIMLLLRPEDIAQVFYHNQDKVDRGEILGVFNKIFGQDTLFSIPNGPDWQKKRKTLVKWVLEEDALADVVHPMQEIIEEFIKSMKDNNGNIASLETFLVSLTMEVFAGTRLASKRLGDNAQAISDEYGRAIDLISLPINNVWLKLDNILKYFRLCATKHLDIERDVLQKTLKKNFFDFNQENLLQVPNILQETFKKFPKDPEAAFKATMNDIGLLLLAGHETTSRLLQFAIISLYQNPGVLKKLREEIELYKPQNGTWTYQDLQKLTYLDCIIKETLRLYPPVPIIPRMVTQEIRLADIPLCKTKLEYDEAMKKRDTAKDVILKPGDNVNIAPWFTHKLDYLYPDPLKFNPDRFVKHHSLDYTENYSWFPFGFGTRNCPGRHLAKQETKLTLLRMVEEYDFELSCKGANLGKTKMHGTLKHDGGPVELHVVERPNEDNVQRSLLRPN